MRTIVVLCVLLLPQVSAAQKPDAERPGVDKPNVVLMLADPSM